MAFLLDLSEVTGTESVGGTIRLIDRKLAGNLRYMNSGVGLGRGLDSARLDYEAAFSKDDPAQYSFMRQGERFNPTRLNMPANCLDQGPHCHPGGEFSYVVEGEYFDADMDGLPLRTYPAGSTVFYSVGSTHRPLSRDGANILYIPFDGIVFGKGPEDLARRMVKIGTTDEAVEYALMWMIPDKSERQRLMDEFAGKRQL